MPLKPKQPFRTTLSINDIRRLAWNATQGDSDAYSRLQKENRRLAKLANSRLRALEKAGLDMFAYDRAITYLKNKDSNRFSSRLASSDDWRGMVTQLSELVTFINAKTSTVAQAKEYMDKKLSKFSEYTGKQYTESQKYHMARLLGTDTISTLLRDVRGASEEVVDFIEEFSKTAPNEKTVEEMRSIIDKYLAGYNPFEINDNLNYDEMMSELRNIYERS